jgi:hypothetical protein
MKKSRQKTNHQRRSLQPQDLAAVRGGDNGTIHVNVGGDGNTVGGGGVHD